MIGALRKRLQSGFRGEKQEPARDGLRAAEAEIDSELEDMIGEEPPSVMRATGYVVLLMILTLFVVSAFVTVDVVVEGTGELAMDAQPIVLQPMERGIIRAINVKPGEMVVKGQSLATLDSTFADADVAALQGQRATLESQVRRLEAEANGQIFKSAPDRPSDTIQLEIYNQRQEQYASKLKAYDEEIQRMSSVVQAYEHDMEYLVQQLAIAKEVERMRQGLSEMQYTSRLQLLESQNMRLRAERENREALNRKIETAHGLESKRAERQAFMDDWRRSTLEELERHRADLARLNEIVAKAERMRQLIDVNAPDDGVVLDVASRSAGSVMREAEPLVTMVSTNAPMIADVLIASRDIGYAKPGDEVRIKVDAYPYQRHGLLMGVLRSVSETSYSSPAMASASREGIQAAKGGGAGSMHRARIELTKSKLDKQPDGTRLIPGMSINAEIKIGSRSVLSYFFDPIRRGFDESLREPS